MKTFDRQLEIEAIKAFARYQYNFESDFIQKAWTGTNKEWLIDHFETKFKSAYNSRGAGGALLAFWFELDYDNQAILANYILNYYKFKSLV